MWRLDADDFEDARNDARRANIRHRARDYTGRADCSISR
jgi:hypothetical protein